MLLLEKLSVLHLFIEYFFISLLTLPFLSQDALRCDCPHLLIVAVDVGTFTGLLLVSTCRGECAM